MGITYAPVFVAYDDEADRFFLVSANKDMALPTPAELHGHFGDLVANPDDRLGCHKGFLPWPPSQEP